jgi:hypothetical protein
MEQPMSIFITPVSPIATTPAKDKRDTLSFVLVLFVVCLSNLVLALASEPFARAVELIGQH